jgi:DNA ligase-1
MSKREFVQLAYKFDPTKYGIGNWLMSEKLDGCRALWIPESRGFYADEIPFANTEKDGRLLQRRKSTGLWSRYGKPIHAPDWFLDKLPLTTLDGELYMGNKSFQKLMSVVKDLEPGPGWRDVQYVVFDCPSLSTVLSDGEIKTTNFKKVLVDCRNKLRFEGKIYKGFETEIRGLERNFPQNDIFRVLEQVQLPSMTTAAMEVMNRRLDEITDAGGEGLMLRKPGSLWLPERTHNLLKVKKLHDAEGTVIGYTAGRKTELGSKLLGLMGAMILKLNNGRRLELSGFTDDERQMVTDIGDSASSILEQIPGLEVPGQVNNPKFPRGSSVTFRYRELSDDGIPKEARYLRRT